MEVGRSGMGVEFGLGGGGVSGRAGVGGGVEVRWGWKWDRDGVCTFPYRVYPYGSQHKNMLHMDGTV